MIKSRFLCIANSPFPLSLQPLAGTIPLSASVSLTISDNSCKWNHAMCVLL